eukprot:2467130-Pyramimonas_sp.AAC.1
MGCQAQRNPANHSRPTEIQQRVRTTLTKLIAETAKLVEAVLEPGRRDVGLGQLRGECSDIVAVLDVRVVGPVALANALFEPLPEREDYVTPVLGPLLANELADVLPVRTLHERLGAWVNQYLHGLRKDE